MPQLLVTIMRGREDGRGGYYFKKKVKETCKRKKL